MFGLWDKLRGKSIMRKPSLQKYVLVFYVDKNGKTLENEKRKHILIKAKTIEEANNIGFKMLTDEECMCNAHTLSGYGLSAYLKQR